MKADFKIHYAWGDHIEWWSEEDWNKIDLNKDTVRVWGHMPIKPRVGNTLMGEFEKSFIKFEFVSVEHVPDPPDMFFADIKAIEQEMKDQPCSK